MRKAYIVSSTLYGVDRFLLYSLDALSESFDITIVCNCDQKLLVLPSGRSVRILFIAIQRNVNLLIDFSCLLRLTLLFLLNKPDLVISVTPKGGLLTSFASFLAFIPCRYHIFTGQVWCTKLGFSKIFLKYIDKLIARLAVFVAVDSISQLNFLLENRVVSPSKAHVIHNGSLGGVNILDFTQLTSSGLVSTSASHSSRPFTILFMARITKDKGALVAARSYALYRSIGGTGRLLFVGPDEENLITSIYHELGICRDMFTYFSYTDSPAKFFFGSDVFFMPSLREGFGSVYLLAAAAQIPSVGSRIYGTTDAIIDGFTGLLCDAGDVKQFAQALLFLEKNPVACQDYGLRGRERAIEHFNHLDYAKSFADFFTDQVEF